MKKRPNRLEKAFVATAMNLLERRLWQRFDDDALFMVQLADSGPPLVVSILGGAGEQLGLSVMRGEHALQHNLGMLFGPEGSMESVEAGDLCSVCFDPWHEVPDQFRRLIHNAGLRPHRDRLVPVVFVSPPYSITKAAGRTDLRQLLAAMRAILQADDAGDLTPWEADRDNKRILCLRVEGTSNNAAVTTSVVDWPEITIEPPKLAMLPDDLQSLPRVDEVWLLGRSVLPAMIEDEDRQTSAYFAAIEDGPIVACQVALGEDLQPAIEMFVSALRGEASDESSPGLPSKIIFGDERLFGAIAPALTSLGIQTDLDPTHPLLKALRESLAASIDGLEPRADSMGGLDEPTSTAPFGGMDKDAARETLEFWKYADATVAGLLASTVEAETPVTDRALVRYFGSVEEGKEALDALEDDSVQPALIEWFCADYLATKRSKTVIEKIFASGPLDADLAVLLKARQDAIPSIFRIDMVDPAGTLELSDVLSGQHYTIHDQSLAQSDLEGYFLPLRLLPVRDWYFPVIAGPPLSSFQVGQVMDLLGRQKIPLGPGCLKENSHLLGLLWSWHMHQVPPTLRNTDGDALELLSITFHTDDPTNLANALKKHRDFDYDENQGTWIWFKVEGPGELGSLSVAPGQEHRTVLATLTLFDDSLLVEVNSRPRMHRIRKLLEAIPGVHYRSQTTHDMAPEELPMDDQLPSAPAGPVDPELIAELKSFMLTQAQAWLDTPVPALQNKTPRQACKTRMGRVQVTALIQSMPPMETPAGRIPPPRTELMRELGIE